MDLLQQKTTLLVVRKTFDSIRDSVFKELMNAIEQFQVESFITYKKTTLDIEFSNGSKIIFKGGDDENKLLSISGIDRIWVEEVNEITQDLFNQLELRLRGQGKKKQFFLSFNPIDARHWLKEEFFDNPKADSFVCHTTYLDNTFLDQDYIDTLLDMKERNPEKYKVYVLGEWGATGKQVFTNWTEAVFDYKKIIKRGKHVKLALGVDFGWTDPSTLACVLIDLEKKELFIFDEIYEQGLTNEELTEKIIEKGFANQLIIADSAERKSIEECRGYGLRKLKGAVKGGGSIMNGIRFLHQFTIYIHSDCKNAITEFQSYSYVKDSKTGQYTKKLTDDYNHFIDALRYAVEPYMRGQGNQVKFLPKSLLGL